jgi:hypothetical protein
MVTTVESNGCVVVEIWIARGISSLYISPRDLVVDGSGTIISEPRSRYPNIVESSLSSVDLEVATGPLKEVAGRGTGELFPDDSADEGGVIKLFIGMGAGKLFGGIGIGAVLRCAGGILLGTPI